MRGSIKAIIAAAVLVAALTSVVPAQAANCTTSSITCTLSGGGTNTQGITVSFAATFNPTGGGTGLVTVNGDQYVITCIKPGAPYPGNSLSFDWVEFFIEASAVRLSNPLGPPTWYLRLAHHYGNTANDRFMGSPTMVPFSACNADLMTVYPMTGVFVVA